MLESQNSYPWLFRQGLSPIFLLIIYVSLSCGLFIVDLKYHSVDLLRKTITLLVEPLQYLVQIPETKFRELNDYFVTLNELQAENQALKTQRLLNSKDSLRLQQIQAENARLKQLLLIKEQQTLKGEVAQILYISRDPFSKKVVINRGDNSENIQVGQAVIDEKGVVGQITQTFPFTSEVTLITDKNQSIYAKIRRTGQRALAFGMSNGLLDLRYVPHHMDVKIGDVLETSGLDNIYPAGFPVAKVVKIDRNPAFAFTQIHCEPLAAVENSEEVLVLNKLETPPDYQIIENNQNDQDNQDNQENDNENTENTVTKSKPKKTETETENNKEKTTANAVKTNSEVVESNKTPKNNSTAKTSEEPKKEAVNNKNNKKNKTEQPQNETKIENAQNEPQKAQVKADNSNVNTDANANKIPPADKVIKEST